jgi:hypothetical protein
VLVVVGLKATDPEVPMVPLHDPEGVQEVALVDDHDRVDEDPLVMEVGLAEMVTVGAGRDVEETPTVTLCTALPQVNV